MKKSILSIMLFGCMSSTNPVIVRPDPIPNNGYCLAAEQNLLMLNCKEGKPTQKGKYFHEVCEELQAKGVVINPKCLSEITSCEQVESCTGP